MPRLCGGPAKITAMRSLLLAGCLCLGLTGCTTAGYYWQLARGQMQLLSSREPIAGIVGDSNRDPKLRGRLSQLQQARRFASEYLHLPDNGSYTLYADLKRDYVVWNVFATPEFSLAAVESCFPIAGCLAYRGYFSRAGAEAQAAKLKSKGYEVEVGGVPAYSTLGWFDDPVINTMMRWSDAHLIGTLFHELAHQRLYVKNDTAFNESFASFVEEQGRRDYLALNEVPGIDESAELRREQRNHQFVELILATREQLQALYAQPLEADAMRQAKQAVFDDLRARYRVLRDETWGGYAGYDDWFSEPLNNARLLPFGLYDQWVPAFAALWREQNRDWPAFYEAAARLGALSPNERQARLEALAAESAT
ncbi:aminopeptidase [Hydrocarboniphaga effusa]|uniref:aminopeptidase n=1 Tax=Hydrocarboniphaga TaxID=243627 RepID=UPI00398BC7ED